jgi:signal transduction histidine kinase
MNSHPANFKADILIVDDTPDNIRFLSSMLLEQGYRVRKALNGNMAITAVRTLLPDLILLDISMPGMSGYEVCQQLKEDAETSTVPIIFLSALDAVEDKVRAFQVGGVDYITKPFQFEEVLARIQTQLMLRTLQTKLETQNETLQRTLSDLRKAQAKLVQQEKMIGLSQLVAGVSHEINNPISFIAGNLGPARQYIDNLLNLVRLYQQEFPNPTPAIQAAIEAMDLKFLLLDLPKALNSMQTGVERVRNIILAFRIFARLDESDIKHVDIHEGIDSTLVLLKHRLDSQKHRPGIQVIKNYGDIPYVTCYASQLNQVFLNLINNAIDALDSLSQDEQSLDPSTSDATPTSGRVPHRAPTIWISTKLTHCQSIQICIKDNGPGISPEIQSRLFEPFYTTKPVGRSKGLGLAISHEIIVGKHKGQLVCHSTLGQGTEFMIEISDQLESPIQPSELENR